MDIRLIFIIAAAVLLLAGIGFWLFAMAPRLKNRPNFDAFKKFNYAHRGLHGKGVPENSLAGFRLAAERGFGMEFDLQLSGDGAVVVHHDNSLKRLCGVDSLISELSFAALSELRLSGTDERIPLFSEVLSAVDGRVPLIIELKGYGRGDALCEKTCEILEGYQGLYCIESFDPLIVEWFKNNRPEVIRGQLMAHFKGRDEGLNPLTAFLGRNLFSNVLTRPDFEAYDYQHRKNPSLRLCRLLFGIQEVSWTLRDPKNFKVCKAAGSLCIFEGFDPRVHL